MNLLKPNVFESFDGQIDLHHFESHNLEAMNRSQLMDRVDTKFVLPLAYLQPLLDAMSQEFSILEIDGHRLFNYHNTYFDSPELRLYHAHHNGKLNRFKVRHRIYTESATAFMEVKFKDNKKRTQKSRRVANLDAAQALIEHQAFLKSKGIDHADDLQIIQQSRYSRLALASESRGERLTIDLNLQIYNQAQSWQTPLPNAFIVEMKQAGFNRSTAFFELMRRWRMTPTSFSKYCMGIYYTHPAPIKKNRFKRIAHQLERQLSNLSGEHYV